MNTITSSTVTSSDGTAIAFEMSGTGSPVILVDGSLCYRAMGPSRPLAELLAKNFTVFTYDRRGRGESADAEQYQVEREVEDLEAVIKEAGGSAYLYGISSGAALALEAANRGLAVTKLALYEAPFIVDGTRNPAPDDYPARIEGLLAADRRGTALKQFMRHVGVPAAFVAIMPLMPGWPKLKEIAHTLPYDNALVVDNQKGKPLPTDRWTSVTVPTLVINGGKSPAWIRNAAQALVDVLPNARHQVLDGQTHMVKAPALAPVLAEFFA